MATTSPDNIWTPNSDDQYSLVQDLATTATSVQTAFDRRANAYKGTSTQRQAFNNAPAGVMWQDTNGSQLLYVRKNNNWETVVPGVVEANYTFATPFTPFGGSYNDNNRPMSTRSGDWVEVRGVAGLSSSNSLTGSTFRRMFTLNAAFRPNRTIQSGRLQGSSSDSWFIQVETTGEVNAARYSSSGSSDIWLPFQIVYFSPRP